MADFQGQNKKFAVVGLRQKAVGFHQVVDFLLWSKANYLALKVANCHQPATLPLSILVQVWVGAGQVGWNL